jgi:hypothetical protein
MNKISDGTEFMFLYISIIAKLFTLHKIKITRVLPCILLCIHPIKHVMVLGGGDVFRDSGSYGWSSGFLWVVTSGSRLETKI